MNCNKELGLLYVIAVFQWLSTVFIVISGFKNRDCALSGLFLLGYRKQRKNSFKRRRETSRNEIMDLVL